MHQYLVPSTMAVGSRRAAEPFSESFQMRCARIAATCSLDLVQSVEHQYELHGSTVDIFMLLIYKGAELDYLILCWKGAKAHSVSGRATLVQVHYGACACCAEAAIRTGARGRAVRPKAFGALRFASFRGDEVRPVTCQHAVDSGGACREHGIKCMMMFRLRVAYILEACVV